MSGSPHRPLLSPLDRVQREEVPLTVTSLSPLRLVTDEQQHRGEEDVANKVNHRRASAARAGEAPASPVGRGATATVPYERLQPSNVARRLAALRKVQVSRDKNRSDSQKRSVSGSPLSSWGGSPHRRDSITSSFPGILLRQYSYGGAEPYRGSEPAGASTTSSRERLSPPQEGDGPAQSPAVTGDASPLPKAPRSASPKATPTLPSVAKTTDKPGHEDTMKTLRRERDEAASLLQKLTRESDTMVTTLYDLIKQKDADNRKLRALAEDMAEVIVGLMGTESEDEAREFIATLYSSRDVERNAPGQQNSTTADSAKPAAPSSQTAEALVSVESDAKKDENGKRNLGEISSRNDAPQRERLVATIEEQHAVIQELHTMLGEAEQVIHALRCRLGDTARLPPSEVDCAGTICPPSLRPPELTDPNSSPGAQQQATHDSATARQEMAPAGNSEALNRHSSFCSSRQEHDKPDAGGAVRHSDATHARPRTQLQLHSAQNATFTAETLQVSSSLSTLEEQVQRLSPSDQLTLIQSLAAALEQERQERAQLEEVSLATQEAHVRHLERLEARLEGRKSTYETNGGCAVLGAEKHLGSTDRFPEKARLVSTPRTSAIVSTNGSPFQECFPQYYPCGGDQRRGGHSIFPDGSSTVFPRRPARGDAGEASQTMVTPPSMLKEERNFLMSDASAPRGAENGGVDEDDYPHNVLFSALTRSAAGEAAAAPSNDDRLSLLEIACQQDEPQEQSEGLPLGASNDGGAATQRRAACRVFEDEAIKHEDLAIGAAASKPLSTFGSVTSNNLPAGTAQPQQSALSSPLSLQLGSSAGGRVCEVHPPRDVRGQPRSDEACSHTPTDGGRSAAHGNQDADDDLDDLSYESHHIKPLPIPVPSRTTSSLTDPTSKQIKGNLASAMK